MHQSTTASTSTTTPPPNYQCIQTLESHTTGVSSVKFSPDGLLLATASGDKTVKIWKVRGINKQASTETVVDVLPKLILAGHKAGVNDISWTSDSKFLASCSDDYTVKIWNVDNVSIIRDCILMWC